MNYIKTDEKRLCEKCKCMLVPVNSIRYNKWLECIRAINTPDKCSGTDLHPANINKP